MSTKDTGGPAYPFAFSDQAHVSDGMTLRQYAAIKLKVPDSGTDWLDEMITTSLRDDFAAKAMQGMLAHPEADYSPMTEKAQLQVSSDAYAMGDAMLEARSK